MNDVQSGDKELVQQQQNNKVSLPYNPEPYTVISKQEPEVTVKLKEGVTYSRSIAHIKKYHEPLVRLSEVKSEENSDSGDQDTTSEPST